MIRVRDIWQRVRDVLMLPENHAVLSEGAFCSAVNSAVASFCAISKSVVDVVMGQTNASGHLFLGNAVAPPYMVTYDGKLLAQSEAHEYLETYEEDREPDHPVQWSLDISGESWLRIDPPPRRRPDQVEVDGELLGTISDCDLYGTERPLYGTIGHVRSSSYCTACPLYGVLSGMYAGRGHVMAVVPRTPPRVTSLDGAIWGISREFESYITYGVLAYIFGSSSELKDSFRESYCRARFNEGIALAKALFTESAY